MQEILHQLGGLVLGSVPTICFFLILLAGYSILVRRPLDQVLAERHARTGGAMDQAQQAIAAAEGKTSEYESKMRDARARMFEAEQQRLKLGSEAREKALQEARARAQQSIHSARAVVEQSGMDARKQLEGSTDALAAQIVATILPNRTGGSASKQRVLPA